MVNTIHASGFVLKTQYNTDKSGLEKKINDAVYKKNLILVELLKKDCNAKINEIEVKLPNITSLAATFALNIVDTQR